MIIDLEKEREKASNKNRYACPNCQKVGEYCPEWIWEISPDSIEFLNLPLIDKLEWLYHTRHLRYGFSF
jgi:hypothetical protein